MNKMYVRVNFEIGHKATLRSKRTVDGFTHDWEVFVKGCDDKEIQHFIDKVVFHLHETFPNPRRVIKEPPYKLCESGYAGFVLPIDIYLRNSEEPKKISFTYDLNLQMNGPISKIQKEKFEFYNPNDEFRQRLLNGGGQIKSATSTRDLSSSSEKQQQSKSKSISAQQELLKKQQQQQQQQRVKEPKADDFFTNIFGTPMKQQKAPEIVTKSQPKASPTLTNVAPPAPASLPPPSSQLSTKSDKNTNPKKSKSKYSPKDKERDKEKSNEKNQEKEKKHRDKDEKKSKERTKEKERKKGLKKERSSSPLIQSESPKRPPGSPPIKLRPDDKKSEEKLKTISKKSKHEQKEKEKEKKERKSHKDKSMNKSETNDHKNSSKEVKSTKEPKEKNVKIETVPQINKDVENIEKPSKPEKEPEKLKHKHKKKDSKEKKERQEEKSREKKEQKKSEKDFYEKAVYKEEIKDSPKEVERINSKPEIPERNKPKEKSTKTVLHSSEFQDDSSEASVLTHDESSIEIPPKESKKQTKDNKKQEDSSTVKKRKRKHDDKDSSNNTQPAKMDETTTAPKLLREENENTKPVESVVKNDTLDDTNRDYMSTLKELQHKIMTLQDNSELQRVVQLIASTGNYEITAQTFDFDLCALDRDTVRKLQEFFTVS